jgi:eukaryotic-like serine/threonine-protein kinase
VTARPPSIPPVLAGFEPIELVGSGGYADVFLYEQLMPRRRVAVKVLVSDALAGDTQRRQFAAEANLMAKVSTHPYIVTIFQADVASDGRPYLVMEYYPGDNYLQRARREQFGVAEVLRVGVQVGSAVHTAHLAGILHRDIKPANILTSEFRRPGLTDFGIASAQGPDVDETAGVSIPWSPPEALGSGELGVAADVYSLAATLYHLLSGHSPYEVSGGDNGALALMSRIERGQVPRIGRPDVPASLERVLVQAMAKNPDNRPRTVVDFLWQLQGVEAELKLAVTPLELADHGSAARVRPMPDDDDATRIKGITEIHAQTPTIAITSVPANPIGIGPIADRHREGLLAEPAVPDTVPRIATPAPAVPVQPTRKSNRGVLIGAGAVLVIAAAVIGFVVTRGGDSSAAPHQQDQTEVNDNIGSDGVVAPEPVATFQGVANADGTFTFTWVAPGVSGEQFAVTEVGGANRAKQVAGTTYTGSTTCIEVETIAANGLISAAVRGCAP